MAAQWPTAYKRDLARFLDVGNQGHRFPESKRQHNSDLCGRIRCLRSGTFFAGLALALFSLFYFIYDGRGIFSFLLNFIPAGFTGSRGSSGAARLAVTASYVRATILVALTDSLGVLIVALILGVPVAPALAALVFLGAFVPIVGALVSGSVAVLVALVALGWVQALIMLGGVILVMQIEGHVLQPFLLGRAVKLHPLAVLIAIAIGIIAAGIVGALLAVPLLAFTKSFVCHWQAGRSHRWEERTRRLCPCIGRICRGLPEPASPRARNLSCTWRTTGSSRRNRCRAPCRGCCQS